jgi:hypothetical protein
MHITLRGPATTAGRTRLFSTTYQANRSAFAVSPLTIWCLHQKGATGMPLRTYRATRPWPRARRVLDLWRRWRARAKLK